MFSAQKTVPDTSLDMSVAAVQLTTVSGNIGGYLSFIVLSGPTVFCLWRLGDASAPTAAEVVAGGFPVHPNTGQPISVQDPADPADPSRLYLACETGGGGSDLRAWA